MRPTTSPSNVTDVTRLHQPRTNPSSTPSTIYPSPLSTGRSPPAVSPDGIGSRVRAKSEASSRGLLPLPSTYRLRRHHQLLGQGRAHASQMCVVNALLTPSSQSILNLVSQFSCSLRACPWPGALLDVQPLRDDLRIRRLVRLVQGPLGHDARPPQQAHAPRVQGRRGQAQAAEAVDRRGAPPSPDTLFLWSCVGHRPLAQTLLCGLTQTTLGDGGLARLLQPPTCVSRWMDGSPERRGPAERGRVEKSTSRANAGEMGRPVLPSPPMYLQPHDAELPTLSCHSTCTSRTSCPMLCPLLSVLRTSAYPANSTYDTHSGSYLK